MGAYFLGRRSRRDSRPYRGHSYRIWADVNRRRGEWCRLQPWRRHGIADAIDRFAELDDQSRFMWRLSGIEREAHRRSHEKRGRYRQYEMRDACGTQSVCSGPHAMAGPKGAQEARRANSRDRSGQRAGKRSGGHMAAPKTRDGRCTGIVDGASFG